MKKVVFALAAIVLSTVIISCKNEAESTVLQENQEQENTLENPDDLALADVNLETTTGGDYLYVTASSGLSLREFGNLQSNKLAKMPYGTKVKVIKAEDNVTMTVSGIKGGMDEIEFNHKKGFAFNGYLSKYFPPELNITVKDYTAELQKFFPDVTYTELKGGTASNPENTETILLPDAEWHEAFYIAQRLFDFPKEFEFPNPNGKTAETIFDGKPKKGIWTSQLEVARNDEGLEKITYVYSSKQFDAQVSIEKDEKGMKISRIEKIK
ncbi:MAG: SH3 domain-containing protein [Bacteroidia bacterium]|nr:SH3 domain-containing protein [Bacteroidia bacterium]NNF30069.1 SH3 domain-containing protein [Flavobacteriaceae bacterium]MBT8274545.1 SH3 domain-containing protein [Bacteroidia bacterium]NNJ81871.1 SH3 domain-containing protein [Flavobacteriaceae bacterium]NNK53992.1 SH3 domain-containing protein [Flavobacteriaceae bacterium]